MSDGEKKNIFSFLKRDESILCITLYNTDIMHECYTSRTALCNIENISLLKTVLIDKSHQMINFSNDCYSTIFKLVLRKCVTIVFVYKHYN